VGYPFSGTIPTLKIICFRKISAKKIEKLVIRGEEEKSMAREALNLTWK